MTACNRGLIVLVLSLLLGRAAQAGVSFDLESGSVWAGSNDVRIPSAGGTLFSLTDDLKTGPAAFFRARATWHLNDRDEISFLFAPLRLDASGAFPGDTSFAGTRFKGGVDTAAHYRFDSYRLTYRHQFIKTDDFVFGLGLTANLRDAEIEVRQHGLSARDDNTGFVPLVNFRLEWKFAPRWSLLAEGDALYSNRGRLEDVGAAIQWRATDNLLLRLGYRLLEGGVDSDKTYNFALFHHLTAGVTWRF